MASDWWAPSVAELQQEGILLVEDGNHGEYRPRPDEFTEVGTSFIRAADIDNGEVLFQSASRINERARLRITKGIGAGGDVLITHKGTVGKVALVPLDAPPFVCSPQTTFWRTLQPKKLDRRFLYAFLRSPIFKAQLETRAGETDMAPYVSLTAQRAFKVQIPPIDLQQSIGHAIGTLDDQIGLCRRMNQTLEAMAQTLFKSWFVDFDPVNSKAEGREPEGIDAAIAALFPSEFEDSELGPIPAGWRCKKLEKVLRIVKGKSYKSVDLVESHSTALVTLKSFLRGGGFNMRGFKPYAGPFKKEQVLRDGDLIVSYTDVTQAGEVIGRPAMVTTVKEFDTLVASLDVGIVRPLSAETLPRGFFLGVMRDPRFQEHTRSYTSGTTVLHLSSDAVPGFIFTEPPPELIERYEEIVEPMLRQIRSNIRLAQTLAELRDTLLPKLMSGQIRVPEAEALVSA